MPRTRTISFSAAIEIIGINPFVYLPEKVLQAIFQQAGKEKGTIPVKGTINDKPYKQTLIKYSGEWRLYINTVMLKNSPKRAGEVISVTIVFDPEERTIPVHPKLAEALKKNAKANEVFKKLSPSRQKEIIRYISSLKTEASVNRNTVKAIRYLAGRERFVGRDKP